MLCSDFGRPLTANPHASTTTCHSSGGCQKASDQLCPTVCLSIALNSINNSTIPRVAVGIHLSSTVTNQHCKRRHPLPQVSTHQRSACTQTSTRSAAKSCSVCASSSLDRIFYANLHVLPALRQAPEERSAHSNRVSCQERSFVPHLHVQVTEQGRWFHCVSTSVRFFV
jgi:hypothetical protein